MPIKEETLKIECPYCEREFEYRHRYGVPEDVIEEKLEEIQDHELGE